MARLEGNADDFRAHGFRFHFFASAGLVSFSGARPREDVGRKRGNQLACG